jgi:pimeloyl-ACP methyl ester carboxylesterase
VATTSRTGPTRCGHLSINGVELYHEVYGDPDDPSRVPLLLIPGAFLATDSMAHWVHRFVADRAVIVFDQQGHGRSPDTARPISYEQFGDDAAALLGALDVERAAVMGYSQGGGVALQLALRHPHLVSKLVTLSATYRRDGWYPEVLNALSKMRADDLVNTPIGDAFRRHTPDPDAFVAYVAKMRVLNLDDQHISDDAMHGINANTMVIIGDADGVRPEHAVDMFKLRGGGDAVAAATGEITVVPPARLVILPATSHISIGHADTVLAPLIGDFLDDVPPPNPALF